MSNQLLGDTGASGPGPHSQSLRAVIDLAQEPSALRAHSFHWRKTESRIGQDCIDFGLTGSKQRKQHLDLFFSLEKQSRDKEAGPGPLVG